MTETPDPSAPPAGGEAGRPPTVDLDPQRLRALAHPLRVRMLNLLRDQGPSTATRLAQQLDQSSGLTSYHLRQLAAHGFVAEDEGRGTARERWWRAVHRGTSLGEQAGRADPVAAEGYLRAVIAADFQRAETTAAQLSAMPEPWQAAFRLNTTRLRLDAETAARLGEELTELVERYERDDPETPRPPGTSSVVVGFQVLPILRPPRSEP